VAIANYSDLGTAVLSWLDIVSGQAGVSTARMADAALLVNARLRRRLLSVEGLSETTGTTVNTTNVTTMEVPAGFRGAYRVELIDDSGDYQDVETLGLRVVYRYGYLELQPPLSDTYTYRLQYWGTLSTLSAAGDSNWVLENAPDVYLYGMLMHLGGFLADERTQQWAGMYDQALEELLDLSNKMVGMRASVDLNAGGGTP